VTKESLIERFGIYGQFDAITLINRADPSSPDISEDESKPRSAFAFIRYINPGSSSAAIEHENGAEWHDRRIRVQYCESPEMKNKRRQTKYINQINHQFANQFYRGVQVPPPMLMQTLPSMKMSLPSMYNMPIAGDLPNGAYPYSYPMMAYANSQSWGYPPTQPQLQRGQRHDTHGQGHGRGHQSSSGNNNGNISSSSNNNILEDPVDSVLSLASSQLSHLSLNSQ